MLPPWGARHGSPKRRMEGEAVQTVSSAEVSGQLTDRYSKAVEQLGHGNESVRLGGLHALARIARDSPGDRSTVYEVISAFCRYRGREGGYREMPEDMQAALRLLARRAWAQEEAPVRLAKANLYEAAPLAEAHLCRAVLTGADLQDADLQDADLRDAVLENTNLRHAHLEGANLAGADVEVDSLREVHFDEETIWPDGTSST